MLRDKLRRVFSRMSNTIHNRAKPEANPTSPRTLRDVVPGQLQFWLLRFSRQNGAPELIESRFQLAGNDENGNRLRETLAVGNSLGHSGQMLDALCIVAVKARREIALGHGTKTEIQVQKTAIAKSYAGTLVNGLHKAEDVGKSLFGSSWDTMRPVQTSRPKGRKVAKFTWFGEDVAKQLQIHIGGDDTGEPMRELSDPDELLNLAADLEAKHPDKWTLPLIQRPPAPGVLVADKQRLARWRQAATDWDQQLLDAVEEAAQPGFEQNAAAKTPLPWNKVLPAVARWALSDDCKGWTPGPDSAPASIVGLQAIKLRSDLRLPALYELAEELRRVALMKGHVKLRRKPSELTRTHRPADETAVLLVPLLEPEDPQAGQPVRLKAFRGWLKVERIPVPKGQNGEPLWKDSGNFYPSPVVALLDQDEPFKTALKNAEAYVHAKFGGKEAFRKQHAAFDFRWSLATDGGMLPPVLFGNHLGAAFALALGKAAGLDRFSTLDLEGVAVAAALEADGRLTLPPALAELEKACRTEAIPATAFLLVAGSGGEPLHQPDASCWSWSFTAFERLVGFLARDQHIDARWPGLKEGRLARLPKWFVPRAGHRAAVERFLRDHATGFLEIRLDVGEGKTTFLQDCVHRATARLESPIAFVTNTGQSHYAEHLHKSRCAQLARKYGVPAEADLKLMLTSLAKKELVTERKRETIWLDAADQVAGTVPVLPEVFQEELPKGFRCVITTRPFVTLWRRGTGLPHVLYPAAGQETEAANAGRRKEVADYLRARFPQLEQFPDNFIREICEHPGEAPWFKTVNLLADEFEAALESNPQARPPEAPRWRQRPRDFLLRDLERKASDFARHRRDGTGEADAATIQVQLEAFWRALALLALTRQRAGLTQSEFVDLGLWIPNETGPVFDLAANLLHHPGPDAPYAFRHPDDARLVLGEFSDDELKELGGDYFTNKVGLKSLGDPAFQRVADRLVKALVKSLGDAHHSSHTLALARLPSLLRETGRWEELLQLLCGPAFPLAKSHAGLRTDLVVDYDETARALPAAFAAHDPVRLPRGKQLAELITKESLHRVERAAAGRLLARLGDPRAGVGLIQEGEAKGLPDIQFTGVWLPPVEGFLLGETGEVAEVGQPRPYQIAKFPVTVAQYAAFKQAGGYNKVEYWAEAIAAGHWRKNKDDWKGEVKDWQGEDNSRRGPFSFRKQNEHENAPVMGVNWYEATAFLRWFTDQLKKHPDLRPPGWNARQHGQPVVKLPHEAEWEQAARWNGKKADGRKYPWGQEATDAELGERCNCVHSGIDSASAVGLFPRGQGECGAHDLCGNVWEWCENVYSNEGVARVLRGGSWFHDLTGNLSSTVRNCVHPRNHYGFYGFRCVVVGDSFR